MSIPIWVTDPIGNNNPFLKIVSTIFVALEDAIVSGIDTVDRNPQFWWSENGINWTLALTVSENQAQNVTLKYGNGTWMAAVNWESIPGGNQNIDSTTFYYSTNGKTWTNVFQLGPTTTFSQFNNFDEINNRWDIAYAINNGPVQHFYQTSPAPLPVNLFADLVGAFPGQSWTGHYPLSDSFQNVGTGNVTPLVFNYTLDGNTWVPTQTFTTTGQVRVYYGKGFG